MFFLYSPAPTAAIAPSTEEATSSVREKDVQAKHEDVQANALDDLAVPAVPTPASTSLSTENVIR